MVLRPWVAPFAAAVACASVSPQARAQDEMVAVRSISRPISRAIAWSEGAARGPNVAVASAAANAASSVPQMATGLSLPPRVTFAAGPRYGSLGSGLDYSVTAFLDIPLRPLASARSKVGDALVVATSTELARARIDGGFAAAVAWSHALEAKEVLAVRTRGEKGMEGIVGIASKRVKAGVGLPSELMLARGDYGAAGAATLDAEGGVIDSYAELRLAIGAPVDEAIDPVGELCKTNDAPIDEKAVYAEAETSAPIIASVKARSALAAADVSLVRASWGQTIGFGAQYAREGFGEQSVLGMVSIPLPIVDPARFDTARAKIAAAEATADVERARLIVRKLVAIALHDRIHTREVRKKLLDDALEPLREAVRLAHVQYETGTQDLTAVLLTRQRLFTVEEQVVRACGAVHRADFAVLHLLGKAPS
ncbi:MAG: TolC family protein [Deltaproteobacteria bacterium]|nr:TolC family protein [Deltaproteobacteria bacterium]